MCECWRSDKNEPRHEAQGGKTFEHKNPSVELADYITQEGWEGKENFGCVGRKGNGFVSETADPIIADLEGQEEIRRVPWSESGTGVPRGPPVRSGTPRRSIGTLIEEARAQQSPSFT